MKSLLWLMVFSSMANATTITVKELGNKQFKDSDDAMCAFWGSHVVSDTRKLMGTKRDGHVIGDVEYVEQCILIKVWELCKLYDGDIPRISEDSVIKSVRQCGEELSSEKAKLKAKKSALFTI